ncbi:dockerin type I repeat-containing protein [Erysipelothrix anatis]|uniref:dockerin type I repeat-containing protein n=1 Tax=Erysipelothrix anatis TaxID=2683713 RepID=UPI001356D282|nr:dockerin type I repeat-containing protein [Erysipelothrix anatis]
MEPFKSKIVTNVLLVAILSCLLALGVETSSESNDLKNDYLVGDVNGDEILNISDMAMIKSHLMGVRRLEKAEQLRADINKDGIVDGTDLEIVRIIIQRKLGVYEE